DLAAAPAAHAEQHELVERDGARLQAAAADRTLAGGPELPASRGVIRDRPQAGDDDLVRVAPLRAPRADDDRRAPARALRTRRAPAFLAGLLVERDEERVALVVPVEDEQIAVQDRRAPCAELLVDQEVAEVHLPRDGTVEAERVDPERAERHV